MAKAWPTQLHETTKTDKPHAKGSGENETARAQNKLATDVDKEEVAGRQEEQKVTLQNGRVTIVTVQYIGGECVIFDGNDQLVEQTLNIKIKLLEILQSFKFTTVIANLSDMY